MKIKILQWNIWYKERAENIAKFIKEVDPDVVCLQELTIGHSLHDGQDVPRFIANAIDMNYNFAPAHTFMEGYIQGNGIFSKFPIIESDNFLINEAGDEESYSSEGRSCAVSTLQLPSEKEVIIATAHSSYNDHFIENEQKKAEIRCIYEYFLNNSERTILAGDFNIPPHAVSIQHLEGIFKNVGPNYSKKTWTTKPFAYNGFEVSDLDWRLDYMFASGDVDVVSCDILKTSYSDHLPILAEFRL